MNIFDLLCGDMNLREEYKLLMKLYKEPHYQYEDMFFETSLCELFSKKITKWKYRGTAVTAEDILDKLELKVFTNESRALNDILKLIQLILNVKLFLDDYYEDIGEYVIFENIDKILKKLNYDTYKEEDRILLIPKNIEVLEAVNATTNNLKVLLVEYLNFENINNILTKKRVLNDISFELEHKRCDYNKINKSLTDNIFHLFNKMNIRHNNKEGKYKNEIISKMNDKELLYWYDKTYEMIIYLINQEKNNKNMREVDELISKIEKTN